MGCYTSVCNAVIRTEAPCNLLWMWTPWTPWTARSLVDRVYRIGTYVVLLESYLSSYKHLHYSVRVLTRPWPVCGLTLTKQTARSIEYHKIFFLLYAGVAPICRILKHVEWGTPGSCCQIFSSCRRIKTIPVSISWVKSNEEFHQEDFTLNCNRLFSTFFWLSVCLLSSFEETITLKLSWIYSQEEKKKKSFNLSCE